MNPLVSRRSWLLAPFVFVAGLLGLVAFWSVVEPATIQTLFDNDGHSPVELMTLPLFALIVPLVWLCPPAGGTWKRQCGWSAIWSLLGIVAIVRETDLHKALFSSIWPEVEAGFKGTVFKMRFLKAADIPWAPKLFVLVFFILFFVAVLVPLIRYMVPLFKGFFRFEPVAWTMATFGVCSVMVLVVDRLPSKLKHADVTLSDSTAALLKAFEEGGEALMALLALLAILQSYLLFAHRSPDKIGG